ncbi:MAG: hypothetical protein GY786_13370, partial [Proteobacteria bacterium]|nr:hypothetical protein [Pseudomonadota bacterium]
MRRLIRASLFVGVFVLLYSTSYAVQYSDVSKPGLAISKVFIKAEKSSKQNQVFTKGLQLMLEKSLMFRNVKNSGEADYSINIEDSVESGRLVIGVKNNNEENKKEKFFGLKFKRQTENYIQSKIASIGNQIIRDSFGVKGALGSTLVWSENTDSRKVLYMGKFGTLSKKKQVSFNDFSNSGASWSPNRKNIVYTSHTAKGSIINVQQVFPLRKRSVTVFKDWGKASGTLWAPDGSIFMTIHIDKQNSDIYQFSLPENPYKAKDAQLKQIRKWTYNSTVETEASVSPDGKQMAYVSDETGNPQIYLMDMSKGKGKRISRNSGYNVAPAWSPDGRYLAYSSIRKGVPSIIRLDPKSGNSAKLTNTLYAESPTWSPDGAMIAFVAKKGRDGVTKIYYSLASGGGFKRLTSSSPEVNESSPS